MTISDTIETYRKRRRQLVPLLLGILIILLVVGGIVLIVTTLRAGGFKFLATKTLTPTITATLTITPSPTETPTITSTATITPTATESAPYPYVVKEGDSLSSIVQNQNLGDNGILLILILNPLNPGNAQLPGIDPIKQVIMVGQTILLPPPGMPLPSPTPWPVDAPPSTRITYLVLPGDSLGAIAAKFNSTVAAIVSANKTLLTKGETTVIYPGWVLIVPVNLVTPKPSLTPTIQPTATQ